MNQLNHLSLFTGLGAFDLAAELSGFKNILQIENDPYCLKILEKNFPEVPKFPNIIEFQEYECNQIKKQQKIDVISGGFPCQPFSSSGNRLGQNDNRYLWPEMLRIITLIKPTWIIGENVPGIINMALEQVLIDLEAQNYEIQCFIIPASGLNAIHRRDRIWFIAYNTAIRIQKRCNREQRKKYIQSSTLFNSNSLRRRFQRKYRGKPEQQFTNFHQINSNSYSFGFNGDECGKQKGESKKSYERGKQKAIKSNILRNNDGASSRMDGDILEGLFDQFFDFQGVSPTTDKKIKNRTNRIKAIGNSIIWPIAFLFFSAIQAIEQEELCQI